MYDDIYVISSEGNTIK